MKSARAGATTSRVMFGTTAIEYAIGRSARKKTVAIAVAAAAPTGRDTGRLPVQVRAPIDTPVATLDAIVLRKAAWIVDKLRRLEDLPPPPSPRRFESGETFLYAGRQYRLKRTRSDGEVCLLGGYLILPSEREKTTQSAATRREALVRWYKARAAERVQARVPTWAAKLGATPRQIWIRDPKSRWGSADRDGNLRFNWRIVQAPTALLDYVIAHELAHLLHPDHTPAFWSALGQAMPDYEARREKLRRLGPKLVW
jgi:hypothetical protein